MNNKIKIAICDDHMIERTIIQIYIDEYFRGKAASAEVKEFCSGTEFIETDVTPYDLAILDIYMDGPDGVETAHEVAKVNPNIRFMFCSASPEFIDNTVDLNVTRYFIKPLVKEKFFDAMDEFMRERATL